MSLLSKFIAKEWFKSLIGALIVLFLLVSIGDIINGFMRSYGAKRVLIEYLLKLPELSGKMFPISALLATLFSLNKLKNHSELMAILAGGYSATKIYRLFLICSLSIASIQFLNLGFIVPMANKIKRIQIEKSQKSESKYLARSKLGKSGLIWYKTDDYFTSFKAFDTKKNILKDVTIYFLGESNNLSSIYKAKEAINVDLNRWSLKNVHQIHSLNNTDFPITQRIESLDIELSETPEDFNQFKSDITTLNFFELGNFITRLNETDISSVEYEIMYFEKISLALICIVFALFPAAGIFNPNRRASGLGQSIVITLLFSIVFWGTHTGVVSLGNNAKIPVLLATLGIPSLFCAYILYIFKKNKRL